MRGAVERASRVVGALCVCAALAACGGDGGSPTESDAPAGIALALGAGQHGVVGGELPTPIGVKVTGASGKALAGVTVNFAAKPGSGTLSAGTWKTNASGIASVSWTLGTRAGANADTLEASVSGLAQSLIVTASGSAADPSELVVISGDAQFGFPGEQTTEPLVVEVHDQYGNPNAGVEVSWSIEGGGTLSAAKDTTDTDGHASVMWTLGAGNNRVNATIAQLDGVSAPFAATITVSDVVALASVSPDTLVEGESATLSGTGFSATPSANKVYVDGVAAVVTAATTTSIVITVPTFDCKPTRAAPVRVVIGGEGSNAVDGAVKGKGTAVDLAVGGQLIVRDPTKFCLQLGANAAPSQFLVGAQSVSEVVGSLTPVTVSTAVAPGGEPLAFRSPGAPLASRMNSSGAALANVLTTPEQRRWQLHRTAEAKLRARERQIVSARATGYSARSSVSTRVAAMRIADTVQVGDTIPIKFPNVNGDFCVDSIPITTVVRVVGSKGIWLEDVANPTDGYTSEDFQSFSDKFDSRIYATDVDYFGQPTDKDDNGRVVIVTSKEVNKLPGLLGFVVNTDLMDDDQCPAGNGGEFYYGRAPDPEGDYAAPKPYTVDEAKRDAPVLIAHEFTHVIQFGRRMMHRSPYMAIWEMEGQATLAQEVVGFDYDGNTPGNDYSFTTIQSGALGDSTDWYSAGFVDLALYYGYLPSGSHAANAPEQCGWLDKVSGTPCINDRAVYGVPWSLLRWISDQFGPSFPGGEKGLQRALIDSDAVGYGNIVGVAGVGMDTLLAQWSAALYTDNLPGIDNPRLRFTTWNLPGILSHLPEEAQLAPRAHGFSDFSDATSVRGGSTAYFTIGGTATHGAAIKLRDALGQPLAANGPMQLWIVRLQ